MSTPTSRYRFSEYSPDWPLAFQREAERLKGLLGRELIIAHHIGSTSVPGLAAKPIIDLLPLVQDIARIDNFTVAFQEAGYCVRGEYGLPGRRYFTKDRDGYRTHNVHIYQIGHPDVERHLAFSAYLRDHSDARREYDMIKRTNYAKYPNDIGAYIDGKDAWIKQTEKLAIDWYRGQPK